MIPLGRLKQHFQTLEPDELLAHLVQLLVEEGQIVVAENSAALANWQPQLSANQTTQLAKIWKRASSRDLRHRR